MKTQLIKIGNSQGIRIPKPLIEQAGLTGDLEMEAAAGGLVIRPARNPRHDWEHQFQEMAASGEDRLIDDAPLTAWQAEEWEW